MQQITVQLWVRLAEYSADQEKGINFITKSEHPSDDIPFNMYTAGDEDRLTFRVMTTDSSAGANFWNYSDQMNLNQWYHLSGTYDGQNVS